MGQIAYKGFEPYHGKHYQIITYSDDIGYDEKYDSDDLNELKQDVKQFQRTEDEVGIIDYETEEWVYAYSKDGRTPALEQAYPLSASLKRKQQRKTERMNSRYAEKDWLSDSRRVKDSDNDFVGAQNFTYKELEDAFNELGMKVYNDPDNLPEYVYDIRNGYSTTDYNIDTDWIMDFDYEQVVETLEEIPDMIMYGDLEVYFNYHPKGERYGYAEPDDHGIFIEDGKITEVY